MWCQVVLYKVLDGYYSTKIEFIGVVEWVWYGTYHEVTGIPSISKFAASKYTKW